MKNKKSISQNPEYYGNKDDENIKLYKIWKNRSKNSLETASDIFEKSNKDNDYDGYLWVITTSYYSMFYLVLSILSKKKWKPLKEHHLGTHELVSILFELIFINNNIIDKALLSTYNETKDISQDLLQYLNKGRKERNIFQYETTKEAEKRYASKHLNNAKIFFQTITSISEKI